MRTILATGLISLACLHTSFAQVRYSGEEFRDYYQWFHRYSQTADPYVDGSTLYTFQPQTRIYTAPSFEAEVRATLAAGQTLTNVVITPEETVFSELRGYYEQWLSVRTAHFNGYVWAGDIAKAWRTINSPTGQTQLVLLGLSPEARRTPSDLRANLRIVAQGQVVTSLELPGACIFEDCGASTLLRPLHTPGHFQSTQVFEISILTAGCLTGLDKTLVSWDGQQLRLVYQAEYMTGHQYASQPIYTQKQQQLTQVCYYSHEDMNYNPVWRCETVKTASIAVP